MNWLKWIAITVLVYLAYLKLRRRPSKLEPQINFKKLLADRKCLSCQEKIVHGFTQSYPKYEPWMNSRMCIACNFFFYNGKFNTSWHEFKVTLEQTPQMFSEDFKLARLMREKERKR